MNGGDLLLMVVHTVVACALMLVAGHAGGRLARWFRQAPVMGELLAGILLGRTCLGHLAPRAEIWLFPNTGPVAAALAAIALVAVVLFLLAAGLEARLATVRAHWRGALTVAVAGFVVPLGVGLGAGWAAPVFFDAGPAATAVTFPVAVGAAFAISALPVIARTLQDLGLLASPFGATVMTAAIMQDLAGWLVFAAVLGLGLPVSAVPVGGGPVFAALGTLVATVVLVVVLFTIGRRIFALLIAKINAVGGRAAATLGLIALGVGGALVAAATDALGIHAAIGALLAGIAFSEAFGDMSGEPSGGLDQAGIAAATAWLGRWVTPLFFVGLGLRADFLADGDLALDAAVVALACAGKLLGGGIGARLAGRPWREALAMGAALNARGAMGIVISLVALDHHLIGPRLFVALVAMALVTSLIAGPLVRGLLRSPLRSQAPAAG